MAILKERVACMLVDISEVRLVLQNAEKAFCNQFWQELEGYPLKHTVHGAGVIDRVDGTHVHATMPDGTHIYSTRGLHNFVADMREIPATSVAAPEIKFNRELESLSKSYSEWQINWRGLSNHVEAIKSLLASWRKEGSFSTSEVTKAREIGVGHIVPLGYEFHGQVDPWNFVRASSAWRHLGQPHEAIRCIKGLLGPALRKTQPDKKLVSAGLTSLVAAFVDANKLAEAEGYADKLSKLAPSQQSALALWRYFRESSNEERTQYWLEQAHKFGADPSLEVSVNKRAPLWLSNWEKTGG